MIDDWMPAFAKLTPKQLEPEVDDPVKLPEGGMSLDGLQLIYRNPALPLTTRFRAMVAALPFETPKLLATAMINEGSFAELLERRLKRIDELKLIDAKPTPTSEPRIASDHTPNETSDARLPPPAPDARYRRRF
jgi:hypothetical protein